MTDILYLTLFFFFNDTATTEIYTLSLRDALPISSSAAPISRAAPCDSMRATCSGVQRISATNGPEKTPYHTAPRSEEHTSELQSRQYLVCRLLLEKKKKHR